MKLVDGNGILHYRGCGSASHLGFLSDVPTIGVAKNPLVFRGFNERYIENGLRRKRIVPIRIGRSRFVSGVALKVTRRSKTLYVSPGHKIDVETATDIVLRCCGEYTTPQPIFYSDKLSREYIRNEY